MLLEAPLLPQAATDPPITEADADSRKSRRFIPLTLVVVAHWRAFVCQVDHMTKDDLSRPTRGAGPHARIWQDRQGMCPGNVGSRSGRGDRGTPCATPSCGQ